MKKFITIFLTLLLLGALSFSAIGCEVVDDAPEEEDPIEEPVN